MKKLVQLSLLLLFTQITVAQRIYRSDKINGHPDIILPRAIFQFDIPVIKATYKRGERFKADYSADAIKFYEDRYGLSPNIYGMLKKDGVNSKTTYRIFEDSVKLALIPRPDYNKMFYFDKLKKWNKTQGLKITYTEDGLTSDGEYTYENKTYDLVVKGLGGIASIVGKFLGRAENKALVDKGTISPILELDEILEKFEILYSPGSTTVNIDIYKDLKSRLQKKYDEAFSKYFYSTEKNVGNTLLYYNPKNGDWSEKRTAFVKAICSLDDATGKLYVNAELKERMETLGREIEFTSPGEKWYTLSISMRNKEYQLFDRMLERDENGTFLPVNIAARTRIIFISPDKEQLSDALARIPQFGKIGFVNIKKPNKLSWQYDTWGELKMKSVGSNAATTDQVAAAQALAEKLKDVAYPDELNKMKREADLIKQRKELEELRKESLPDE